MGSVLSHDQEVADGEWHQLNLTISDRTATIYVDKLPKRQTFDSSLPDPVDLSITAMTLGRSEEAVSTPGSEEQLEGRETKVEQDFSHFPFVVWCFVCNISKTVFIDAILKFVVLFLQVSPAVSIASTSMANLYH